MSARRDWTHASPALRGARDDDPPPAPHALRVVALCTLGFWAVVLASCVAWVGGT
ncbi:MAG: hypothetical protein KGS47_16980 [Chloroflexi bacterium]|nr:hypothetical protein [Chloroflexota bacterium]